MGIFKQDDRTSEVYIQMKFAPLSGGFMITSMIGFLIATMFLPQYSPTWAVVIGVISVMLFVASVISMTKAPVEEELALDEGAKKRVEETDNSDLKLFPRKKK